ncbi:hypothetical protein GCM10023184_23500 [Flaviaesturariibacter amylovorans]|uniref:GWxTD domain-containing protein n=2 Tax=Flaviaesturariibacter amylovorans TaxID=1084520 RepID=A0ABP8GXT6_9BACT
MVLAILAGAGSTQAQGSRRDSVLVAASMQYGNETWLRRLFLGSNYRRDWETPVKLPVFHLKAQGYTISELGGGKQTKSLQLKDAQGREWALRTVDKDVTMGLPPALRKTFFRRLTQDQVSAAHPYAPLVVSRLARAMGVVAPAPKFYYIPDDPDFGEFRSMFAHTVCMLEEREPTPDGSDTRNSTSMIEKILADGTRVPDAESILKARLLDMLVGDWDRHADQWRWADRKREGATYYYGIPRDRDQAFFRANAPVPRFMRILGLRFLVSFDGDFSNLKSLNYKSWPFDRFFLGSLDRETWKRALEDIKTRLTDDVIRDAVRALPAEVYALSGPRIERDLRGRRDRFADKAMSYYKFLSGVVDVYGSNREEEFVASGSGDSLRVQVYQFAGGKRGRLLYERRFLRGDTRTVRLHGLRGNDRYTIAEGGSRIRVELLGEEGVDRYSVGRGQKVRIRDADRATEGPAGKRDPRNDVAAGEPLR